MAEITKDQMERLHRSGVSLSQSWQTYARPDLKTQWQELHQQSALDALTKGIETAAEMEADAATKAAHALRTFAANASASPANSGSGRSTAETASAQQSVPKLGSGF